MNVQSEQYIRWGVGDNVPSKIAGQQQFRGWCWASVGKI